MKIELYQGRDGLWRWRFRAGNGEIIADSGEGYTGKRACNRAVRLIQENAASAEVVTVK